MTTPIEHLRQAQAAREPEEKARLLRLALNGLPAIDEEPINEFRMLPNDVLWTFILDGSNRNAVRVSCIAAALAKLPGGPTEGMVTRAMGHVLSAMTDLPSERTAALGRAFGCLDMIDDCNGFSPERVKAIASNMTGKQCIDMRDPLFRAGAALADARERLKAGEKIGACLTAERHLRSALSIATNGAAS